MDAEYAFVYADMFEQPAMLEQLKTEFSAFVAPLLSLLALLFFFSVRLVSWLAIFAAQFIFAGPSVVSWVIYALVFQQCCRRPWLAPWLSVAACFLAGRLVTTSAASSHSADSKLRGDDSSRAGFVPEDIIYYGLFTYCLPAVVFVALDIVPRKMLDLAVYLRAATNFPDNDLDLDYIVSLYLPALPPASSPARARVPAPAPAPAVVIDPAVMKATLRNKRREQIFGDPFSRSRPRLSLRQYHLPRPVSPTGSDLSFGSPISHFPSDDTFRDVTLRTITAKSGKQKMIAVRHCGTQTDDVYSYIKPTPWKDVSSTPIPSPVSPPTLSPTLIAAPILSPILSTSPAPSPSLSPAPSPPPNKATPELALEVGLDQTLVQALTMSRHYPDDNIYDYSGPSTPCPAPRIVQQPVPEGFDLEDNRAAPETAPEVTSHSDDTRAQEVALETTGHSGDTALPPPPIEDEVGAPGDEVSSSVEIVVLEDGPPAVETAAVAELPIRAQPAPDSLALPPSSIVAPEAIVSAVSPITEIEPESEDEMEVEQLPVSEPERASSPPPVTSVPEIVMGEAPADHSFVDQLGDPMIGVHETGVDMDAEMSEAEHRPMLAVDANNFGNEWMETKTREMDEIEAMAIRLGIDFDTHLALLARSDAIAEEQSTEVEMSGVSGPEPVESSQADHEPSHMSVDVTMSLEPIPEELEATFGAGADELDNDFEDYVGTAEGQALLALSAPPLSITQMPSSDVFPPPSLASETISMAPPPLPSQSPPLYRPTSWSVQPGTPSVSDENGSRTVILHGGEIPNDRRYYPYEPVTALFGRNPFSLSESGPTIDMEFKNRNIRKPKSRLSVTTAANEFGAAPAFNFAAAPNPVSTLTPAPTFTIAPAPKIVEDSIPAPPVAIPAAVSDPTPTVVPAPVHTAVSTLTPATTFTIAPAPEIVEDSIPALPVATPATVSAPTQAAVPAQATSDVLPLQMGLLTLPGGNPLKRGADTQESPPVRTAPVPAPSSTATLPSLQTSTATLPGSNPLKRPADSPQGPEEVRVPPPPPTPTAPIQPIMMGNLMLPGGNRTKRGPVSRLNPPATPSRPSGAQSTPTPQQVAAMEEKRIRDAERTKARMERKKAQGPKLFHTPKRGQLPSPATKDPKAAAKERKLMSPAPLQELNESEKKKKAEREGSRSVEE
ncbi:Fc.00g021090.m01.CDS01 [Cosmosporella sp. VM-42]